MRTPSAKGAGILCVLALATTAGSWQAAAARENFPPPVVWTAGPVSSPAASAGWAGVPEPATPQDLPAVISTLRLELDQVAEWVKVIQQDAASSLARMIRESPGSIPAGVEPPGVLGAVGQLPAELRGSLEILLAKLRAPALPGSLEARHQGYAASSPVLAHEAANIVATDEIVTGAAVQQAAATDAVSVAAAAVAGDSQLPAIVASAHEAGAALARGAGDLPSSRAGIELLVAGVGAGMQQQADLGAAVADRLAVLTQQTAAVSQQIGALATTTGALTAQEAERNQQELDGRLGLADALSMGGQMFQRTLAAAGEPPAEEIRLDPLY